MTAKKRNITAVLTHIEGALALLEAVDRDWRNVPLEQRHRTLWTALAVFARTGDTNELISVYYAALAIRLTSSNSYEGIAEDIAQAYEEALQLEAERLQKGDAVDLATTMRWVDILASNSCAGAPVKFRPLFTLFLATGIDLDYLSAVEPREGVEEGEEGEPQKIGDPLDFMQGTTQDNTTVDEKDVDNSGGV